MKLHKEYKESSKEISDIERMCYISSDVSTIISLPYMAIPFSLCRAVDHTILYIYIYIYGRDIEKSHKNI